jgi:hypothetical protein
MGFELQLLAFYISFVRGSLKGASKSAITGSKYNLMLEMKGAWKEEVISYIIPGEVG